MGTGRGIDLNADLGEEAGDDGAMLGIVTSANLACGLHAGGPEVMFAVAQAALLGGVALGAHPGYGDRANFGRVVVPHTHAELERLVAYQVGAAAGVAALAGHRLTHVKAHGALYNLAAGDAGVAGAVARAIRAVDPGLICLALAGSEALAAAGRAGLAVAAEVFADRAYLGDGTLVPRSQPGAVIHDPGRVAERVLAMLETGAVEAEDGSRIPVHMESICLHGDTPGAVAMARHLRRALERAGHALRPFAT